MINLLNLKTLDVRTSAFVLTASSLISAFLGLVRNRLLGSQFGAGGETDVYLAAFRIPDFIYGIVIMGGITVAFLPLFAEYAARRKEEAWEFVNNLLHVLLVVLGAACVLLAIMAPLLMELIAPGFSPEQKASAITLTRLLFLSPVLFGISSLLSGVLQYHNRFIAYALAPVLYNLGIIAGILFLAPSIGVLGVGIGVVAGATLYLLIQLPSFFASGFVWKFRFRPKDPAIARVLRLALPRIPGAMGYQFNVIAMTALASLLSAGSITVFTFANDLQSFPVNLIGVPFAIAAFPALSRAFAEKKTQEMSRAFISAFKHVVYLVLPLAGMLFLFRKEAVRFAYSMGNFGETEVNLTAALLGVFALGVVFQALIPLLARAFFAMQDTKTPTIIGLSSVALNIFFAVSLISIIQTSGIPSQMSSFLSLEQGADARVLAFPFALFLSGLFQCGTLALFLRKKLAALQP
ncbi:MAG: murein biosynthesis integral membrane protein MurJ [Parcubacteria group bacterium]|nr:murein biosynthesis integral membrane protein MurJ [Parcubacteria group bacterium]